MLLLDAAEQGFLLPKQLLTVSAGHRRHFDGVHEDDGVTIAMHVLQVPWKRKRSTVKFCYDFGHRRIFVFCHAFFPVKGLTPASQLKMIAPGDTAVFQNTVFFFFDLFLEKRIPSTQMPVLTIECVLREPALVHSDHVLVCHLERIDQRQKTCGRNFTDTDFCTLSEAVAERQSQNEHCEIVTSENNSTQRRLPMRIDSRFHRGSIRISPSEQTRCDACRQHTRSLLVTKLVHSWRQIQMPRHAWKLCLFPVSLPDRLQICWG